MFGCLRLAAAFASVRGPFKFNINGYPIEDFYLTKVGKRADIIVVDLDDITLIPTTDPIATFVLRAQPANISHVLVDGKMQKHAGKLVGIDEARVRRLVKESHDYIMGLISSAGLDIRKG